MIKSYGQEKYTETTGHEHWTREQREKRGRLRGNRRKANGDREEGAMSPTTTLTLPMNWLQSTRLTTQRTLTPDWQSVPYHVWWTPHVPYVLQGLLHCCKSCDHGVTNEIKHHHHHHPPCTLERGNLAPDVQNQINSQGFWPGQMPDSQSWISIVFFPDLLWIQN